jgi:hypothetical protein
MMRMLAVSAQCALCISRESGTAHNMRQLRKLINAECRSKKRAALNQHMCEDEAHY